MLAPGTSHDPSPFSAYVVPLLSVYRSGAWRRRIENGSWHLGGDQNPQEAAEWGGELLTPSLPLASFLGGTSPIREVVPPGLLHLHVGAGPDSLPLLSFAQTPPYLSQHPSPRRPLRHSEAPGRKWCSGRGQSPSSPHSGPKLSPRKELRLWLAWSVGTEVPIDLTGSGQTSRTGVVGHRGPILHPQQLPALQSPAVQGSSQFPLEGSPQRAEAGGWGCLGNWQGSWAVLFFRCFSSLPGRKRGWLHPQFYGGKPAEGAEK